MTPHGTILVVDDDRIVRDVYRLALQRAGWEVRLADDAAAALAAVAAEPGFALVCTDLALPGALDGEALVERLRADHPGLPVLVSSGWIGADVHERLVEAGIAGVLQKPVPIGELIAAVEAAARAGAPAAPEGARPRVLVADDDPSVRALLARTLREAGYAPVEAADGAEAFDRVLARRVDAAFVDLRMPRLDGVAGIGALHQLDPGLTVIVVTAEAHDAALVARALAAGAMACLAKPVDLARLRAVAEAAIAMTAERRALHPAYAHPPTAASRPARRRQAVA